MSREDYPDHLEAVPDSEAMPRRISSRNVIALVLAVGVVGVLIGSLVTIALGIRAGRAAGQTEAALLDLVTSITTTSLGALVGYLAGRANGHEEEPRI